MFLLIKTLIFLRVICMSVVCCSFAMLTQQRAKERDSCVFSVFIVLWIEDDGNYNGNALIFLIALAHHWLYSFFCTSQDNLLRLCRKQDFLLLLKSNKMLQIRTLRGSSIPFKNYKTINQSAQMLIFHQHSFFSMVIPFYDILFCNGNRVEPPFWWTPYYPNDEEDQ